MTKNLPLRKLAKKKKILIGTAVSTKKLKNNKKYRQIIKKEFNVLTAENDMKFQRLQPEQGKFDFSNADYIMKFAKSNKMKIRGHTLVWNIIPKWLEDKKFTRDELIKILKNHIQTVVKHYRGKIYAWDVLNEGIENKEGYLRDNLWLRVIGKDYIKMIFQWAHEADPKALLFYNDHSGEWCSTKSNKIYKLVKDLLKQGVPIHGVGLQMHFLELGYPKPKDIAKNIKRLTKLGLQVHITEMDVRIKGVATKKKLEHQAQIYKEMFKLVDSKTCNTFVMWGFTDASSWVPKYFKGFGSALIFDDKFKPKPAYYALQDVLSKTTSLLH